MLLPVAFVSPRKPVIPKDWQNSFRKYDNPILFGLDWLHNGFDRFHMRNPAKTNKTIHSNTSVTCFEGPRGRRIRFRPPHEIKQVRYHCIWSRSTWEWQEWLLCEWRLLRCRAMPKNCSAITVCFLGYLIVPGQDLYELIRNRSFVSRCFFYFWFVEDNMGGKIVLRAQLRLCRPGRPILKVFVFWLLWMSECPENYTGDLANLVEDLFFACPRRNHHSQLRAAIS